MSYTKDFDISFLDVLSKVSALDTSWPAVLPYRSQGYDDYSYEDFTPFSPYDSNLSIEGDTEQFDLNYTLPFTLYQGACELNGTTKDDCVATCTDVGYVFSSIATFRNCIVSPSIVHTLPNASATDTTAALAFGLSPHVPVPVLQNITSGITACLSSYCLSDPQCQLISNQNPLLYICDPQSLTKNNMTLQSTAVSNCMVTLCSGLTVTLNPDFGGIGVLLSYYIQLGIAVAGFLLLGLFSSWIYHTVRCVLWIHSGRKAKITARRIQDRYQTHLPALVTGLVEFQKAQCFFMIAVQIAALVVTSQGSLDATSLVQVQLSYNLFQSIAAGGYLPVTFNLVCLRQHGKRSWYIFLLSLCTFGLSAATLFGTIELNSDGIVSANPIIECGNNDLIRLCTLDLAFYKYGNGGSSVNYNSFAFAAVMMFLLTIDQFDLNIHQRMVQKLMQLKAWCEWMIEKGNKFINWPEIWTVFSTTISKMNRQLATHVAYQRTIQTLTRVKITTWNYIQLYFGMAFGKNNRFTDWVKEKVRELHSKDVQELFDAGLKLIEVIVYQVVLAFYLISIFEEFTSLQVFVDSGTINTNNWGFGQIVGITVWFPALFEYLYLELRGLTKGSDYRLAHGFEVTKKTEEPLVLEGEGGRRESHEMELLDESKDPVSPPSYSSETMHKERRVSFGVGPDQWAADVSDRLLLREEDVAEARAQHFV